MTTTNLQGDPTLLDHQRVRNMLDMDAASTRVLDEADRNRLHLVLNDLNYDGCITETAARRIEIVANGGHVTAVLAMACVEADANRASARAVAEITLVLTQRRMPR